MTIIIDDNYIRDMKLLYDAVNSLEDVDKQLVLELYENMEKLSVIGNTYGYSVSGVKYRINGAIMKICAIIYGYASVKRILAIRTVRLDRYTKKP